MSTLAAVLSIKDNIVFALKLEYNQRINLIMVLILVLTTSLVSYMFPEVKDWTSLLGGLTDVTISFYFPLQGYYNIFKNKKGHWLSSRVLILVGYATTVCGFVCTTTMVVLVA